MKNPVFNFAFNKKNPAKFTFGIFFSIVGFSLESLAANHVVKNQYAHNVIRLLLVNRFILDLASFFLCIYEGGFITGSTRSIPLPVFADASMTHTYYLNEEGCFRCQKILTMIEVSDFSADEADFNFHYIFRS